MDTHQSLNQLREFYKCDQQVLSNSKGCYQIYVTSPSIRKIASLQSKKFIFLSAALVIMLNLISNNSLCTKLSAFAMMGIIFAYF